MERVAAWAAAEAADGMAAGVGVGVVKGDMVREAEEDPDTAVVRAFQDVQR
jgi:hypothetical protein